MQLAVNSMFHNKNSFEYLGRSFQVCNISMFMVLHDKASHGQPTDVSKRSEPVSTEDLNCIFVHFIHSLLLEGSDNPLNINTQC